MLNRTVLCCHVTASTDLFAACLSASSLHPTGLTVNVCLKQGLSNISLPVHSVVTNKHCMLIALFIRMFLQDGRVPAPAT